MTVVTEEGEDCHPLGSIAFQKDKLAGLGIKSLNAYFTCEIDSIDKSTSHLLWKILKFWMSFKPPGTAKKSGSSTIKCKKACQMQRNGAIF